MGKLINCATCKQQIAAEAKICPHCGAKNKKKNGCGCLTLLIIIIFLAIIMPMLTKDTPTEVPEGYNVRPSTVTGSSSNSGKKVTLDLFPELKNNPAIEKVELTNRKVKVVYKKDLPDPCFLAMRKLAHKGSQYLSGEFTAECSVAAAPDKILYRERRIGNIAHNIVFAENLYATDKRKEAARLTEAARQKKLEQQKLKSARAYGAFTRRFINKLDGSCPHVVSFIKNKMNDPGSFEHIKTEVFSTETENFLVEMTFRGKNAYGAKVVNKVSTLVTPDGIVSMK